jgi:hypothetical protein
MLMPHLKKYACSIKMVAGTGNEVISVQVSKGKLSDKKEVIVCDCCEKMKVELHDVKLELSSFREIIRVLQEEISPSTQPTAFIDHQTVISIHFYILWSC